MPRIGDGPERDPLPRGFHAAHYMSEAGPAALGERRCNLALQGQALKMAYQDVRSGEGWGSCRCVTLKAEGRGLIAGGQGAQGGDPLKAPAMLILREPRAPDRRETSFRSLSFLSHRCAMYTNVVDVRD